MSDKKKISVVVLGNEDSLKKALITNISGEDSSKLSITNVLSHTKMYENDAYKFTCTTDMSIKCEDIREIFTNHQPDMCLLVVEDGFSTDKVRLQIEELHRITGKPKEDFRVVLPFSYEHPFRCYTTEQVSSELSQLAKERKLLPSNKSPDADPDSTPDTLMENKEKNISVVDLGNEMKELITNIPGKDLHEAAKTNVQSHTETYENNVECTPDLNTPNLVVEDGHSAEEVSQQIENLQTTTGKPTEEFRGMLHLTDRCDTVEQVSNELTENRNLMPTNHSPDNDPDSTPDTVIVTKENKGGSNTNDPDSKKNLKTGKYSATKVTLVLLGMAGAGKSASGNTILREKKFTSLPSSNAITTECKEAETEKGGTRVRVIDTPDMFDDDIESSVKNEHVKRCKQLCQSGPCVYLLVMHVSRFTDGERDILKKVEEAFGSKVQEQTVVLFTRGDDLQHAEMSFEEFLSSCQPDLKKIIEKCGNRCVVFENRASDSDQVEKLMQTVDKMLKEQQKQ